MKLIEGGQGRESKEIEDFAWIYGIAFGIGIGLMLLTIFLNLS